MTRLDTSLEAAGAEFLVLGYLLIEGIQANKAYTNFPGYDIIATNPERKTSCRIQVKSRWATDFDGGFPIRNFECEFVVLVALNRGFRYRRKKNTDTSDSQAPCFYVFPVDVVKSAQKPESSWGKVFLRNIDDANQYIERWDFVRDALNSNDAPQGGGP